jgi:hypothetical protein
MPKPPGDHLMTSETTSRSNVEEIWRKHGWVPPSTEDPVVFKRQLESRGVYGVSVMRCEEKRSIGDKDPS